MKISKLNLQQFAEDGGVAAPAEGSAAGGAETAVNSAPIQTGDTLADGTRVPSARVAAAMEKQMQRHPELRKVYGKGQAVQPAANAMAGAEKAAGTAQGNAQGGQPAAGADAEADLKARWEEAKKGEFASLYGQDIKNAVYDRFKNQQDLQAAMDRLEPALKVLRERAGVESNDDLAAHILDDDSLYEDAANEAGMTVDGYKEFMKLKQEHEQHVREQAEYQRQEEVNRHYQGLVQQSEEFRKQFPDFDLQKELSNPEFLRLTSPAVGVSIEDAYFAVHHREIGAQQMAYGMKRAQQQMAQTIMANGNRPREGGMGNQTAAAADMKIDPRGMTRKERDAIRQKIHNGARGVTFD